MIYLILDVCYQNIDDKVQAKVAGIRFTGIEKHIILNEYIIIVDNVDSYQSGRFYKREMPCLIALIEKINDHFDLIIIDGYVYLDGMGKWGLGRYLYDDLPVKKPIIGVAKNHFYDISQDYAVYRGKSKKPLYVTCVDFNIFIAKNLVKDLQGNYRIPDIIQKTDKLSRTY